MENGYILDYVYEISDGAGEPRLYARTKGEEPYLDYKEYVNKGWLEPGVQSSSKYLNYIRTDGKYEGFFEYVVLYSMGEMFYLFWHASTKYKVIVCSYAGLEMALKDRTLATDTSKLKQQALNIDFRPTIEYREDEVVIRVMTFQGWEGVCQEIYTVSRNYPHELIKLETNTVIKYASGFVP
jgi:hypothetical protein